MPSTEEPSLLHSDAHYRAIVEDQTELISLATPEGRLTYVNPAYARHFGLAPARMVGMSLYDFIDPVDRDGVRERFAHVLASGTSVRSENRMLAADGSTHWVSWTNGVSRDADGQMIIHSVGRDITDRRIAEQALRTSQSFLYRTGRAAGVGGWEVDLGTSEITWSEETRRIHEVEDTFQPTLDTAIAFYPPDAQASLRQHIGHAISTGEGWDLELPLITRTGRPIWVRAVGEVEYEAGQPARLVGAFQDISERKRLEQEKATQTTTLNLITETIPAGVATIDMDGRYTFTNGAYAGLFGRTPAQLRGQRACDVLGEEEYARRRPYIERARAGERVAIEVASSTEGALRYVSVDYIPLLDGKQVKGIVIVGQDVTQQRLEALRLLELTQRDPLTSLLNRSGFEQFLERQVLEGHGHTLGLLYIDLDDFKPINDRFGHPAGDRVLVNFAQRLKALVRDSDAVARLGGDEFAVLLTRLHDADAARHVADKVLASALEPFDIGAACVRTYASVGIAYRVESPEDISGLVRRADEKLLEAKAAGKGRRAG